MYAGWITFSAYEEEDCTIVQIQVLVRANDPAYELGSRLGATKSETRFWQYTVKSVAAHCGVNETV